MPIRIMVSTALHRRCLRLEEMPVPLFKSPKAIGFGLSASVHYRGGRQPFKSYWVGTFLSANFEAA